MKVLIACEFSGIVREAFKKCGHESVSCDLLPSEIPGNHLQGNVLEHLNAGWDLMVAHPPCTFLANSGVRWLYTGGKKNGDNLDLSRWRDMELGAEFFRKLLEAPIPRIAVENPIIHKYAAAIIGRTHDQIIQPWQFGHGETKATCFWLKNLPPLQPTQVVEGRDNRVHYASEKKDRWKERSRTLPGIAEAMATQWGGVSNG